MLNWKFLRAGQSNCFGERYEIGGVFLESSQSGGAELAAGIREEKVRASVDSVHRLAALRFAGIAACQRGVSRLKFFADFTNGLGAQGTLAGSFGFHRKIPRGDPVAQALLPVCIRSHARPVHSQEWLCYYELIFRPVITVQACV